MKCTLATTDKSKYSVPALDKGLDILEYLSEQELPLTQAEIAHGVGRGANEIYRVLVGLEARGYLIRDEQSGRYRISLKLYTLTRSISPLDHLRQCALPHMEDLAVQVGQSCHLSVLYEGHIMVIIQARSQVPVSISISEGSLFPSLSTTSGRLLLANLSDSSLEVVLGRDEVFGRLSKAKKENFYDELKTIRTQGFYNSPSEFTEGVCDFAALIGSYNGKVNAALAVSSLHTSMSKKISETKLQGYVCDTAKKITEQLGC